MWSRFIILEPSATGACLALVREPGSRLAMTHRATRHVLDARHPVRLFQVAAQLQLTPEFPQLDAGPDDDGPISARLFVRHVEYFLARPEVLFRRAVAVEAKHHEQRLRLVHQRHLVDLPMAGHAADALFHVDLMIEVHEVW